jgi:hypothetical protein
MLSKMSSVDEVLTVLSSNQSHHNWLAHLPGGEHGRRGATLQAVAFMRSRPVVEALPPASEEGPGKSRPPGRPGGHCPTGGRLHDYKPATANAVLEGYTLSSSPRSLARARLEYSEACAVTFLLSQGKPPSVNTTSNSTVFRLEPETLEI